MTIVFDDHQQTTSPTQPETLRMTTPLIAANAIEKSYSKGQHKVPVLRGAGLSASRGEFISVIGQSGSGKSTLLHVMGLLDDPDVGEVLLDGRRIDNLSQSARDQLRNHVFGFVFQFYHLLPELSLLENVMTPLMIRHSFLGYWRQRKQIRQQAMDILQHVGLEHRVKHRPSELSGGEMQRGAIARALIAKPEILLADEPTGNLDSSTGSEIMDTLKKLNEDNQLTIVMVTHDEAVAQQAHRIVRLKEGRIANVGREEAA
ncbi:ABC transporter ATP-binding protein [Fuerstiella marisgermanici]|uniref:Lipoprotein-releasing system ATP-binding protein LolD n=1 Tax=Fuerstiella marisgermanici TaxID=1891926 RepID=A0A1P8WIA8_9PLAN|nr:ABC transporter ATP-binding protein [Fuerstiella marisgermanici]APZ93800.1 Lipoprotein-releasing system ATP-binding protein LolD [Fuerstiella marisgermanici]